MEHDPYKRPAHGVRHLAIIMDGNGRWARKRGLGRAWGHRRGAKRVDEVVTACCELGVSYLTLYAFSTENWNRPEPEVRMLMRLLIHQLRAMDSKLVANRVSLVAQGSLERLPVAVRDEVDRVVELTRLPDPSLTLCLSLSYGSRQEITDAARSLACQVRDGLLTPEAIDESHMARALYRPDFPDPDLLVRTGGECRVSNFLLWQIAYSEFYVDQTLWPDFGRAQLEAALDDFTARERRFGQTSEQRASVQNRPIEEVRT